jgi:hypothetical protein
LDFVIIENRHQENTLSLWADSYPKVEGVKKWLIGSIFPCFLAREEIHFFTDAGRRGRRPSLPNKKSGGRVG